MKNINTEAIYYGHTSTTKSGYKITFAIPDREAADMLDDVGAGKRYMMALVPLTDDDQPDEAAVEKAQKPKRRLSEMPLSQQAALMCQDSRLWDFIDQSKYYARDGQLSAAGWLRSICKVESRSDLDLPTHTEEAQRFLALQTEFDVFTGRIAGPR